MLDRTPARRGALVDGLRHGFTTQRSPRAHRRTTLWLKMVDRVRLAVPHLLHDDGPFTRETAWHRIPHHLQDPQDDTGQATITREEPCDYRDNALERYYPVKTADGANEAIYGRYKELAAGDSERLTFIGRCGNYRCLDME